MECRGVDVFVIHPGRPEKLPREAGALKLELVSNRGTQFDITQDPGFLLVDWHRCRYTSSAPVTGEEIRVLLTEISKNYIWEKVQKLFVDEKGEALYSKAH